MTATDADNDTLTYTIGGDDAAAFSIVSTSGQLQTKDILDFETKSSYTVTVTATDGNSGSDAIDVTITVTDITETNNPPVFTDGTNTTRTIAENTVSGANIGSAVTATDADNDTLTYTIGGDDAAAFSIVSTSGQLQTKDILDFETKSSYTVTVTATDGNSGSDAIDVTITVTDITETNNPPVFTDATNTTRTIAENTAANTNIGAPVTATDADNDVLTYTIGGTDKDSFSIVSTSGQLQTKDILDFETKSSYTVTVTATDGNSGSDAIDVTIAVTDVTETNNPPVFTEGTNTTRSIAENTASGTNIGTAVEATDVDSGTTLTYTLGGTDSASFSIVSTSGQLQTKTALDL